MSTEMSQKVLETILIKHKDLVAREKSKDLPINMVRTHLYGLKHSNLLKFYINIDEKSKFF